MVMSVRGRVRAGLVAILLGCVLVLTGCRDDSERVAELVRQGAAQEDRGDLAAARASYDEAIATDPQGVEARRASARLHLRADEFDAAAADYRVLRDVAPADVEANLALAEFALRRYDAEQASLFLAIAEESDKQSLRARGDRAAVDYYRADPEEGAETRAAAAATMVEVLAADPTVYAARAALIDWIGNGDSPEEALPVVEAGLKLGQHRLDLQMLKLFVLQQMGDDGTLDQMKLIYRDFPENPDIGDWLSDYYASDGPADEAIAFFADLAARRGNPPEDHRRLIAYISDNLPAETAIVRLREIARGIGKGPVAAAYEAEEMKLRFGRGETAAPLRAMEALTAEGAALARDPDALLTTVRMLEDAGRHEDAEARLARLLVIDPTNDAAIAVKVRWMIDAKDHDAALSQLMPAVSRARPDPGLLLLLAETYEAKGLPGLARNALAEAVQASDNGARESLLFATFLARNGQEDMAGQIAGEGLAAHPEDGALRAFAQSLGLTLPPLPDPAGDPADPAAAGD